MNSFIIDESKVEKDMVSIIKKNRDDFRKRINKKEDFVLSKKEALKLKKQIEQMHEDNFYQMRERDYKCKKNIGRALEEIGEGLIYQLAAPTTFDGTNYIDTGVAPLATDVPFTVIVATLYPVAGVTV